MQRPTAFPRYSSADTAQMAGNSCCRPDFFQTPFGISIEHGRISRFCQRKDTLSGRACQEDRGKWSDEPVIGMKGLKRSGNADSIVIGFHSWVFIQSEASSTRIASHARRMMTKPCIKNLEHLISRLHQRFLDSKWTYMHRKLRAIKKLFSQNDIKIKKCLKNERKSCSIKTFMRLIPKVWVWD